MTIRGIAHRGYPVNFPENTLSSFQAAINLGFSHMELDVHMSKDGIPVVIHDHTIDRMTDGNGEIYSYTLEELKQFTITPNEKIPTLEEVLQLAKDRIHVSIELKKPNFYSGIEKKVYEIIHKLQMEKQTYIISFNHDSLRKLRAISKDIQIGPLVNKVRLTHYRLLKKLNAQYFAVKYTAIKEKHIRKCEKLGIQLVVWTVNTVEQMQTTKQYPSILVTTDELEKYKAVFSQ
ncbi:glycerophosphodiester phosphodiesterase [Ornithinibacillus californiensis]|uniref:glycerophosphodiester phosphodiesterase n=1 Tax=Ornithinibacillus californiensis TaxID=161536 RepID=UPI00064D95B7|nr:glycerophosphodiester phosphodiesterase family protein [Ornithinibacillus californiensis]